MKIGIDIHGVADKLPELFKIIAYDKNIEVFILTGGSLTPEFLFYINDLGIPYSEIFSITDHLLRTGTPVRWADKNNPWFDADLWNKAKAEFCEHNEIDIMFDDTEVYAKYFKNIKTKFILLKQIN